MLHRRTESPPRWLSFLHRTQGADRFDDHARELRFLSCFEPPRMQALAFGRSARSSKLQLEAGWGRALNELQVLSPLSSCWPLTEREVRSLPVPAGSISPT